LLGQLQRHDAEHVLEDARLLLPLAGSDAVIASEAASLCPA
jgi:hypothetical protein